jgi:hypothetical protein
MRQAPGVLMALLHQADDVIPIPFDTSSEGSQPVGKAARVDDGKDFGQVFAEMCASTERIDCKFN